MAKPTPMVIGVKGVSYGLQKPAAAAKPVKSSLFSVDDRELSAKEQIQKEQSNNKKQRKAQEDIAKALAQDPTAFAYDEVYDDMKKAQQKADPEEFKKNRQVTTKFSSQTDTLSRSTSTSC